MRAFPEIDQDGSDLITGLILQSDCLDRQLGGCGLLGGRKSLGIHL